MAGEPLEVEGRHINKLESAFNQFWFSICGIPGSPARAFDAGTVEVDRVDNHHLDIRTANGGAALWFRSLPHRPGDNSQVIDARIKFKERVRAVETDGDFRFEIVESITKVQHIEREWDDDGDRVGEARQGVHFDFEESPKDNHPVFHAQFDPACIKGTETDYADRLEIPDFQAPDFPRIPSAPIDVVAATYILLHDHAPGILEEDMGWPSDTHSPLQKLPRFPEDCFHPEPQDGNGMVCDWWYLHATIDDGGIPERDILLR